MCRYISLAELKEMLRTNGIDYYTDDQIQQMVGTYSHPSPPHCTSAFVEAHLTRSFVLVVVRLWQWTVKRPMRKASASWHSHGC